MSSSSREPNEPNEPNEHNEPNEPNEHRELPWGLVYDNDDDNDSTSGSNRGNTNGVMGFGATESKQAPRRLRKAERVLRGRTCRFIVVLDQCHDRFNHVAVLRTCEALGVQHVWSVVSPFGMKNEEIAHAQLLPHRFHKGAAAWLSYRTFRSVGECLRALRHERRKIWVTSLSVNAQMLVKGVGNGGEGIQQLPQRMAIVMGRESTGVSQAFIEAADRLVYLPMFGFSESFNLSVASALVIQALFQICPEARGDMTEDERHEIRKGWYMKLAKQPVQKTRFAAWLDKDVLPLDDLRIEEHMQAKRLTKRLRRKIAESDAAMASYDADESNQFAGE